MYDISSVTIGPSASVVSAKSVPSKARPTTRSARVSNSWESAVRNEPPDPAARSSQRRRMASASSLITPTSATMRSWWNAGCDIRRSRRHAAPSVVTSPVPAATLVRS